ncbi:hypothetical protein [Bartonella sp. WD12.1]|uniref:hypothetical protein n=1 Tax=Bartonella sp. WD12.1 TaxID=1933903 RepID=UPI0009D5EE98|nr:hypothetical protein [Bartonella sp. WD12.1]OPB29063.1 hypothetical protein BWD121_000680 [Bartonella sp. WD12.1]
MFLHGFDNGRGVDQGRKFAEKQQNSLKVYTHDCTVQSAGAHTHNATISSTGGTETRSVNATVVYAIKIIKFF